MKLLTLLAIALSAFAGESILVGPTSVYNNALPLCATCNTEFSVSNWGSGTTAGTTHIINSFNTGWLGYFETIGAQEIFYLNNQWETSGGQQASWRVDNLASQNFLVRCQHNTSTKQDLIEAWDVNGNYIYSQTLSYTAETDSGTLMQLGYGSEPGAYVDFIRVLPALVPINSTPPTTYNNSTRQMEWKFDGSLADSSGNGYTATNSGASTYITTPFQPTVAILLTGNPLSWTSTPSQRAGYSTTLSAANSYSMADTSASVTSVWQCLSGPIQPIMSGRTSNTNSVTLPVFGDYLIQLTVTSVGNGAVATATADIGAVAQDNNGIVVNASSATDAIIGNTIAFGNNPWGFADYWHQHAMGIRAANYISDGWTGYQWEQLGSGTISYRFGGAGYEPGYTGAGTTLTGNINSTTLTIPIADYTKLDLSSLPTRVLLVPGNFPSTYEEVRICSYTVTTSPQANLTVCYDGRGQTPLSWTTGEVVGQFKVTGSGTEFITDPVAAVCPYGAGPTGPASTTAGSVGLVAGSTTVTGSGTAFTSAMTGSWISVSATHSSAAFDFIAQVTYVSATSLTLSRAYPSDADTGTFSTYAILRGARSPILRSNSGIYVASTATSYNTGGTDEFLWNATGCESNTDFYVNPLVLNNLPISGHDVQALDGTLQSGWPISVTDSTGYVNTGTTGGIDFYGEGLASLALYYRSGLTAALNASNAIIQHMIASPWGNADGNGIEPLFNGGLVIEAFAADAINPGNPPVPWPNLRSWAYTGVTQVMKIYNSGGAALCDSVWDTRDTTYNYAWVVLAALYDPDTTSTNSPQGGPWRSYWQGFIQYMEDNDFACERADHSWANAFLWNNDPGIDPSQSFGPLTLTNGSTAATGTGLLSSDCNGVTSGNGSVVSGSATLTITSGSVPASPTANAVVLWGTKGLQPFSAEYYYSGSGSSSVMMSVNWPGDTGSITWMAANVNIATNALTSYGASNSDYNGTTTPPTGNLTQNYACIYNSSTSLTLDHPWQGTTGSTYYGWIDNLAGYGQESFMVGIKSTVLNWIANSTLTQASAYQTLTSDATSWVWSNTINPANLSTNYGVVYGWCTPSNTTSSSTSFDARTPSCNWGGSTNSISAGREDNAETSHAFGIYTQAHLTSPNITTADQVYGAIWGNVGYNTGGVYYDSASCATNINATQLTDAAVSGGKWYGFYAGMGLLPDYPAARLGGVAPVETTTINVPWSATGHTNATKIQITVTQPSGASSTTVCTTSPCTVTADARSGSVMMELDYLNSGGTVIYPGTPLPFYLEP